MNNSSSNWTIAIGELVHLSKEVLKTLWTGVYLEIKV